MGVVLREVIPDGTQWGIMGEVLPHWSDLEFGQDLKGASSISFDYANQGANFDRLAAGMYVLPEVNGRRDWDNSIFYIRSTAGSLMPGSASNTTRFSGISLRGRLDSVRWMPAIGSTFMDDEMFRYSNVTPGAVIRAGVENYWSRARTLHGDPTNWLADVGVGTESYWKYRVDELVEPTTSVQAMITKYQDLGIGTARFEGFHLNTSHYEWYSETPLLDKSDSVQLRVGLNLENGEFEETNESLITALLVKGAQDPFRTDTEIQSYAVQWVVASQDIIDKYGYHEGILEISDASNPTTLKAIGENYMRQHLEPRMSRSYTMVDNLRDPRSGRPLPTPKALSDFQCGDSILILSKHGAFVEKVYAITMSFNNPQHATIGLTLNDYFDDFMVQFDQRLRRLGG